MAKRRGTGEGTIYQLPSGSWRIQVTSADGKRISHTEKTRKAAQDWLKSMQGQVDRGLTYESTKTSVAEFLAGWLVSMKPSLRPKTHQQYSQVARDHIIPYIGDVKIGTLRPDQVQAMYDSLLRNGASARVVELAHSVLHNAMEHALKLEVVPRNVCNATTPARSEAKERPLLTDNQISLLCQAMAGHELEALITMAMVTGMRQGELLGFRWDDLDWLTGEVRIQRQAQREKGKGVIFAPLKTDRSKRTIVIGERMLEMLREHYNRQQLQRQFAGERWQEHGLVFPSSTGTPRETGNFHKQWKALLDKAGVKIRFHDLRHLSASIMLVKLRKPLTEVSARLGHSRTSTTTDIYGHMIPGGEVQTAREMEDQILPTRVDVQKK